MSEYLNPDWSDAKKCHDWKNYTTSAMRMSWPLLTDDQKLAVGEMLQDIADAEHWD